MDWLKKWKYLALLLSLLVLVVVFPILRATPVTRVLLDVMFSIVFLAAFLIVFTKRWLRVVAFLLGTPTLLGIWTGYFIPGWPQKPLMFGSHLLSAMFYSFTISIILRDVHQEKGVSADSVYGAFCGYLLTGLTFGHLFRLVELTRPGSFQGDAFVGTSPEEHHFLLTYFSFLTLTTVGYGDIVPTGDLARGLAVLEAVAGQFYLAVLVAELIGKRVSQGLMPAAEDVPPPPPSG